jgi:hypothetical protein
MKVLQKAVWGSEGKYSEPRLLPTRLFVCLSAPPRRIVGAK